MPEVSEWVFDQRRKGHLQWILLNEVAGELRQIQVLAPSCASAFPCTTLQGDLQCCATAVFLL